MNLIKKTLVGLIIPIQVMAASPTIKTQTSNSLILESEQTQTATLIQTTNLSAITFKPFLNQMMPYILKDIIKDENKTSANLTDQLMLELFDTNFYIKSKCKIDPISIFYTGNFDESCYTLINISGMSSLPELFEKLEKSYNLKKTNYTEGEKTYTKYDFEFAQIYKNQKEYYLVLNEKAETSLNENIEELKQFAKNPAYALKNNIFAVEITDDGALSTFSLDENEIKGNISIPKENSYQNYNLSIDNNALLNFNGLNLKKSLDENQIQVIKDLLGEFAEIILNLKGLNLQTDGQNVQVDIEFHELSHKIKTELDALQAQERELITSNEISVEYIENTIQIKYGQLKEETNLTKAIEQNDIIGHFYLSSEPIKDLLAAEGIYSPFSIKAITKEKESNIDTAINIKLDLENIYKIIFEELNPGSTKQIKDINAEDWYYQDAKKYMNAKPQLFKGETCNETIDCDNTIDLNPAQTITRAEFAALILQYTGLTDSYFIPKDFEDLNTEHKYYQEIQTAIALELMKGDANGKTIRPDDGLNRAEAITMLQRAFPILKDTNYKQKTTQFEDVSENAWYIETLSEAVYEGIIQGTSDTTFSPEQKLNRIEAIIMVQRLMEQDLFMNSL